jgi:hypothetical protein
VRMRSQSSCSWAFPLFGSVLTVTLLIDNGASDVWRSYWPSLTSSRWAGGYCLGRSFRGKRRVTQISNMCSYDNHKVERESGARVQAVGISRQAVRIPNTGPLGILTRLRPEVRLSSPSWDRQ